MKERDNYRIRIQGEFVEVEKPLYHTYYQMNRREKHLEEKDAYHGVALYSSLDTDEMTGEDMLPDMDADSVEDVVEANILRDKLYLALAQLSETEYSLIHALYFQGKTERQYAAESKTHYMTIHYKKKVILGKLLKMIKC